MGSAWLLAAVIGAATPQSIWARANYDEAKVPAYTLPDLLNGVSSVKAWETQRRPELIKLFEANVYGTTPPKPTTMKAVQVGEQTVFAGAALRKEIDLIITGERSGPVLRLVVYLPKTAAARSPVFLAMNFNGNATVDWPIERIVNHGYGLATFDYNDALADDAASFGTGVTALFPKLQNRPDNFAAIGAWAWSLSRALDYLVTDPYVDAQHVIALGHSRLGKTALWAAALDTRFAMVVSNDSGEGGAAITRRRFGETIAFITERFPHWFCQRFRTFADRESELPVDQHMLVALIAPRPVYVASASEDRWADPRGEFLAAKNSEPAYRLYGLAGLPSNDMPPTQTPVWGTIGYHVRAGKHDLTEYDWAQFIAFADRVFERR